jgi:hypothetical protein
MRAVKKRKIDIKIMWVVCQLQPLLFKPRNPSLYAYAEVPSIGWKITLRLMKLNARSRTLKVKFCSINSLDAQFPPEIS